MSTMTVLAPGFASDIVALFEELRKYVKVLSDEELEALEDDDFNLQLALRHDDNVFWRESYEDYGATEDDLCDLVIASVRKCLISKMKDDKIQNAERLLDYLILEYIKIPNLPYNPKYLKQLLEEFVETHWPLLGILATIPKPIIVLEKIPNSSQFQKPQNFWDDIYKCIENYRRQLFEKTFGEML
jgi:hypothetical protein